MVVSYCQHHGSNESLMFYFLPHSSPKIFRIRQITEDQRRVKFHDEYAEENGHFLLTKRVLHPLPDMFDK